MGSSALPEYYSSRLENFPFRRNRPTPGIAEAASLLARLEGLVFDPVYTGRAMAGLIGLVATGNFKPTDTVVFIHTGGLPALFAYCSVFAAS